MRRWSMFGVLGAVSLSVVAGCAGMIVGSSAWFDRQKSDVSPMAAADLQCAEGAIEYKPVAMDDYREVEARGCGKKARYHMVKVGPLTNWSKSGEVSAL